MFSQSELIESLPMLDGKLHYKNVMDSSNDMAADLVRSGEGSGTLVVAEEQTKGRGRGGNRWSCSAGEGLLFSLVLEPDLGRADWPRLALAAGVALADVLDRLGLSAEIKWPNDVWVNGSKCAGVLVEGCGDCVIIGMGVNVLSREFPADLNATSIYKELGYEVGRERLLADIVQSIISWGSRCGTDFGAVVEAVNQRCAMRGEMIQLRQQGQTRSGMMAGVSEEGYLMLEVDGVVEMIAQADEIRLLKVEE